MANVSAQNSNTVDVVLIGAGIMSATLGVMLRQLQPGWSIKVIERLDEPAAESSDAWNNAGTGHSALCELNYTPKNADGSVGTEKAINVNEWFQESRQFWTYALNNNILSSPREWIRAVPHMSFVQGKENIDYLAKRYDALAGHTLFDGLTITNDHSELERLVPLMAKGRSADEPFGLSYVKDGTDVNFGALTKQLLDYLSTGDSSIDYNAEVKDLSKNDDGSWTVLSKDRTTGATSQTQAKFVFVGAGGGSLELLQKSKIDEIKGIGGFPVSGEWLRCTNEELIEQHQAKVYGLAAVGAPPMSVPHLDTRVIDGKKGLLFGPFAGWTPKFLKYGSFTDLPLSVKPHNLGSMVGVGLTQGSLVKYLVSELAKGHSAKVETLREYMPTAVESDWEKVVAGQRVQVIRPAGGFKGTLEFGTAVITSADGSISGLLGASPGASTAVHAMIDVLQTAFPDRIDTWKSTLEEMVPSYGRKLSDDKALFSTVWDASQKAMQLG